MKSMIFDAVLWCLASPLFLIRSCIGFLGGIEFWRVAYSTELACPHCLAKISLIGMWRCGCGYTYTGHLLRRCPICRTMPRIVRCFSCGVSRHLPERA